MNAPTPTAPQVSAPPVSERAAAAPRVSRLARLAWALSDMWVAARRYLLRLLRRPDELLSTLLIPVLAVAMFGFVFGDALSAGMAPGVEYREFLLPGVFALTMAFGVGSTTISLATDARDGVLDRMRSMPLSPVVPLAGRALADLLLALAELAILTGLGGLLGWPWHGGPAFVLAALGLLLLLRLAFSWVGILLGLLVSGPEAAMKYFALVFPLAMVAETIVPTSLVPGWLAGVAAWNPLSATVTATRELFGSPAGAATLWVAEHSLLLAVAWPLAIIAVCVPLALACVAADGESSTGASGRTRWAG